MLKGDILNKITNSVIGNKDEDKGDQQATDDKMVVEESTYDPSVNPIDEELTDEKKVEIEEQVKTAYLAKIEALDERLKGFKTSKLVANKREAMRQANYDDEQIKRHIIHVTGEDIDTIKQSVDALKSDFKPNNAPTYADPSLNNGSDGKPRQRTAEDGKQYGREVLKQAQKGRLGGYYHG